MSPYFIPCPLESKSALVQNPGLKKSHFTQLSRLSSNITCPVKLSLICPVALLYILQVALLGSDPGIVTEKLCVLGQVTRPARL